MSTVQGFYNKDDVSRLAPRKLEYVKARDDNGKKVKCRKVADISAENVKDRGWENMQYEDECSTGKIIKCVDMTCLALCLKTPCSKSHKTWNQKEITMTFLT